jgi:EAL domain-containing protein (putative c-di-GMP-specific phosphodiesterase class I)/GGDEF domain-containing protein
MKLPAFRRLRTRLTVLYAALFGVILTALAIAIYSVAVNMAEHQVRGELAATGTVFDRLWSLKADQMRDSAAVTSRDFGFRSAVATHDEATIRSALDNLKGRLGLDMAFMVTTDGKVISDDARLTGAAGEGVYKALSADEDASGVFMVGDAPFQAVTVPIQAPVTIGWVVFASRLDGAEMTALERLSSIPLKAEALARRADGGWASSRMGPDSPAITQLVAAGLKDQKATPRTLHLASGDAIALVKPLKAMDAAAPAALVLRYPLALALAPYRLLLDALAVVGFIGLLVLSFGSWILARGVTRPITQLDDAARRLTDGEEVRVDVNTEDEIGRLAQRFNVMATGIREREKRVSYLALHDHDTSLPNRRALEQGIAAMTHKGPMAVAVLTIDRFGHVRNAIGYGPSATLVREVGRRLADAMPEAVIARLSTDAVAVAFPADNQADAEAVIHTILPFLEQPVSVGEATVDMALTVGMALHPEHGAAPDLLVDRASIAVDQARAGKRKIAAFDIIAYGDPSQNLSLMSEMLTAIADGQLELHYQPKYDLRSRTVSGVEALVRWNHPTRGRLGPDLFIGMAEETGHIRALTDWVLRAAIEDQRKMARNGHVLCVSVNVSGRLVGDTEFADHALELVAGAGGPLCFEITETAVIDNPEVALAVIDRFAAAGVDISIDDYGSGLSSLGYLKQIRANELKIDKQFVLDLEKTHNDALLVRSTIDLAHSLGLKVTAEGVETETALALLAAMGCDQSQGYFIARPMPLEGLFSFLASEAASAAPAGPTDMKAAG